MKLFDYKFLILLALTLVVYFIFREVLDLRNKIDTLQTNIDNNKLFENKQSNENNIDIANPQPTAVIPFQIPLPAKVKTEVPKLVHNKLSTVDESQYVSETESVSNSDNQERLAIYSNDNHEDIAEDFSLDETSEMNTEDILNNISDKESNINSEEHMVSKKKTLLVEIERNDMNEDFEGSDMNSMNDINEINANISESKHTIATLMRLKLNELQCLAEEHRIDISNSEKGRKKTKTEISNDLLQYFQSA